MEFRLGTVSFAPSELAHFRTLAPTAYAVGSILSPLRGWALVRTYGRALL